MLYTKNVCAVAYVDNKLPVQQGQGPDIAKFKRSIIGQRDVTEDRALRNEIMTINPAHEMLSYIECTQRNPTSGTGPGGGPGYDVLRGGALGDTVAIAARANETCVKVNGTLLLANGQYRYDWRLPLTRELFVQAVLAIYATFPYKGIIVDNGAGFNDAYPDPLVLADMLAGRQQGYYDLAAAAPDKMILVNAQGQFRGVNGEMVENRLTNWNAELTQHVSQKQPRFDIGVWTTPTTVPTDAQIQSQMDIAFAKGAWFYWCQNYQHVQAKDALYA